MICEECEKEVFRGHFDQGTKKWLCGDCCITPRGIDNVPGVVFPLTTMNINGEKVKVQSLRHLRKLEAKHGVHSVAFNTDSKNWSDPPQTDFRRINHMKLLP